MFLKFPTSVQIDHRTETGFRCHGNANIIVRAGARMGDDGSPEVDIICGKCHAVLAIALSHEEAAPADAAWLLAASHALATKAAQLSNDDSAANANTAGPDPNAPLRGTGAPVEVEPSSTDSE